MQKLGSVLIYLSIYLSIGVRYFPKGIFTRATFQVTISQASTSHRLCFALWGTTGCNGGRALCLGWARGPSSSARIWTFGKLPVAASEKAVGNYLSIYLSIYVYIYLSIYLSIYRSIYISIYLSIFIYISIYLKTHQNCFKYSIFNCELDWLTLFPSRLNSMKYTECILSISLRSCCYIAP